MDGQGVKESLITMSQIMQPTDANLAGNVHGGVIMKMIDNAAAVTGIRHAKTHVVTASIDRLSFHHPVYIGDLLTIKSSINMVGNTSLEVGVRVESENIIGSQVRHIASAYLTFVALDKDGKPAKIPPLIIRTKEEERRNLEAQARKKLRMAERQAEEEHQRS
ncbi:MAG: acyl-CoA thioesterase [Deltaproteobacteria bacterium]|jgi:acyl-CoA hydrolase|nr:acyl-CoA thioesterase [Deltaproteobacteria bacterium]MBT4088701.1 acyl-CoA thioesterase [Deltaproteobacteria bacterium]MBT4263237.1 acyl-CoA thioesterase [Deltaproteobacteria bacterium]MBT4639012.1 acyl-CoA thioesterase [Deltaproteobacteria bacterium]MBT6614016.1 acyl-CoA thioesterase [Deltaproteobacteria bacterium]